MSDAPASTAPATGHDAAESFGDHGEVHVKSYVVVFVALLCLTLVTVGISYLHLTRPVAIALGLTVAAIKSSMVAAVFMHLVSEKKVIYAVLTLTVLFFLLVLLLPVMTSGGNLSNL
jgi:cytochrome c oxidase subunit IV